MQHGGGSHPDTHAGTTHAGGRADASTAQHLPALVDAYAHTDRPDTRADACAETAAAQTHAHGKRAHRNPDAHSGPDGSAGGQGQHQSGGADRAQDSVMTGLDGDWHGIHLTDVEQPHCHRPCPQKVINQ